MNNSQKNKGAKTNGSFSFWDQILFGAPQEVRFNLFFFIIFLCDLLLILNGTDLASYADGNTLYKTYLS